MRFRAYMVIMAIGLWLVGVAGAQAPEAAETAATDIDTTRLSVALKIMANGVEATTVEKNAEVEVIAEVQVNLPDAQAANVLVTLNIADELNIESAEDVRIRQLYLDNTGSGSYTPQGSTAPRKRLRFVAPEGQVGINSVQRIKWTMTFKNNAAKAPFSASAALTIPPSNEIVTQDRSEIELKVRTALSVKQLWEDGGAFMWPLGISLIIAIAFALERLWTLTLAQIDAEKFFGRLSGAMKEGGVEKAIDVCNKTRGPVAAVMREGLLRVDQGIDNVEKAIESAGAVEGSFLQRGMVVLASVTTIAPMIGFLGTVWGMVLAFKAIAEAGDVKPSIVADGISQALITTATGLVIAIIVQSLHNFLISRINRIVIDMEETSTLLVDLLIEEGIGGTKS